MNDAWVELRLLLDRGTGLWHRGLTSLRTRGWRASWESALRQWRPLPPEQRAALYLPARNGFAPFAVPTSESPLASIVIPVFNQFPHTLACLRALAAHPPSTPFEVIVVDDGSSDDTIGHLPSIDGVRIHRRARNGGFIAACNDGGALARGRYLVLLNNDTVPQPGWLEALLGTFTAHPNTGLAGAQLLYPDGRLQEAGGLVFREGSGWNYGRFASPDHPAYGFVRETDYCSGAAIAVPTELFRSLGGFDTRFAPAYYEDTDLAFSIRARGLQVRYQPAARVVHDEGTTAGTSVSSGTKAYQARNRSVLAQKWAAVLPTHALPGSDPQRAALRTRLPHVLIVDGAMPRPDRDSASLRVFNLMRLLRQMGAHVVFRPASAAPLDTAGRALQQRGVEVWHGRFAGRIADWIKTHGPRFDTIVVSRYHLMREWLPLLRRYAPQARVVLDTVDLHYLREQRAADLKQDMALLAAAERTRALELDVIERCDATLVVSEVERQLLAQDAPHARVSVLSNLHDVQGSGRSYDERRDLVFVGGFRHPPNVDAVRWFVTEVFPRIRQALPGVQFHCIGSDAPADIVALGEHPDVLIRGHIPDLTPHMDGARVAVAPLRFGAGVKGKINLSMAHGQPVVATQCAVEGMHLRHGDDVLIADDPTEFANAVIRLYRDPALWQRLSNHGLDNIERHFSLAAARPVVQQVLLQQRRK